jgi:aspartyl/asparaginyl beta-hydroxylase (cupin superfamily)
MQRLMFVFVIATTVVAVVLEIHLRSKMPWLTIIKDWKRFGWRRSAVCVASNAALRVWAAFDTFPQRPLYWSDAEIEAIAPGACALKRRWKVVRAEALTAQFLCAQDQHSGFNLTEDLWGISVLKEHGRPCSIRALSRMPKTCQLLLDMGADMALLSRLSPGTTLPRHTGPSFCFLRYHLCLKGDGRAELEVGPMRYQWKEGEHVIFDETLPHAASNPEDAEDRIVLFVDIPRPIFGLAPLVRCGTRVTADMHGWKDAKKS